MDYQLLEIHALLDKTVQHMDDMHINIIENVTHDFFCLKDIPQYLVIDLKDKYYPLSIKLSYPENKFK